MKYDKDWIEVGEQCKERNFPAKIAWMPKVKHLGRMFAALNDQGAMP